jgi:hypothetical protein
MNTTLHDPFSRSHRCIPVTGGLLLGLALHLCASASAQDLLKNGGFEAPFPGSDPTTNWTLVYVDGGPGDFAIAGPSTEANLGTGVSGKGAFGAHLRPNNYNYAHAYFKQIVNTGITNEGHYLLSIKRMKAGFKYADEGPPYKLRVYMVAISGSSSNFVSGSTAEAGYSMVVTGSPTRQIEVQLHMAKDWMANEGAEDMKHAKCSGWFDDVSLTWTP